jgi:prepilin-type N-terminal cleavage/methylation domain-containing protein
MSIRSHQGFTLVELIVALGLFAFVMSIAMGAYLIMIATNREAQAVTTNINNLSYTLESMTRNIRNGKNYTCSASNNSFTYIQFDQNNNEHNVTYSLDARGRIQQNIDKPGNDTANVPITDPLVMVTKLGFYCDGEARSISDTEQANVIMILSGTVSAGPTKQRTFTIQSSATMRGVDL